MLYIVYGSSATEVPQRRYVLSSGLECRPLLGYKDTFITKILKGPSLGYVRIECLTNITQSSITISTN